jgi:hypothetical protein
MATPAPNDFSNFEILKVPDSMQDAPPDIPCPGAPLFPIVAFYAAAQQLILRPLQTAI